MKINYVLIPLLAMATSGFAQQPLSLYPDGVPNAKPTPADYIETINNNGHISKVSAPTLTPYLPVKDKANGTAVIICPGGGYGILAAGHEGVDVAKALNAIGVTAFVLKYRLPSDAILVDKSIGPLQDAQRAIQMVREGAAGWNIKTDRIGILGFSAGGHLASTAGTHFDKAVIANPKNTSLRPDFLVLVYPVISFGPDGLQYMNDALLGKNASQESIDLYSNEKQVTSNTPPTFLTHTTDDPVKVQNSLLFYDALLKNKVKAEMHLYQEGGHGYGLINPKTTDRLFDRLTAWMKVNGWL